MISNRLKNQHLLWRSAFGPMAENSASLDRISQQQLWELLLKTSTQAPKKITIANNLADGLYKGVQDIAMQNEVSKADVARLKRQQSRDDLKTLNLLWLDEIIHSKSQLREKMSFFWHGHFACRVINSFFQQELLHTIRTNALGNFGDLLKEVSKSPSMLQFLNNQQNRRQSPNENFAREVMELFTMGRGNYNENDIKEAARAFTGWGYNLQGEFVFRKQFHDAGSKTFLGRTGNFSGDDILEILLEQPHTAVFITKKIYRYFVNEKVNDKNVQWLAQRFFDNKYDIRKLLEDIYLSNWFYDEGNVGTKIKSPIELLAGIRRFLPLELDNDQSQLLFQKILGQILFYPPNVAGWPGGRSWIDSSTMMLRLQIPQVLAAKESLTITPKNDDDVNMGQMVEQQMRVNRNKLYTSKGGAATIEWLPVYRIFENTKRENLLADISNALLQSASRPGAQVMDRYIASDSRENFIKTAIFQTMATPEYQLC